MEAEWSRIRGPATGRVWHEVLRPVAVRMRLSASELAESTVNYRRPGVPDLYPDAQAFDESRSSTEESLRQLATIIEMGWDPANAELPPSTSAILRSAVWRNDPLSLHLRHYRLAQEYVWQWMFDQVNEIARDRADLGLAVELATAWLFSFVDHAVTRAGDVYEVERETWMHGASAARAVAIDDIVAGRERDDHLASKRLRYPLSRHHVAAVAWIERPLDGADALPLLGDANAAFARIVGAEATISHPLGSLAVAAWFSHDNSCADKIADGVAAGGELLKGFPGVSIALGEPAYGLTGFRRSHLEATHARRVASLVSPTEARLTLYRDTAVTALVTADPDHALDFITRTLGPLAANDEQTFRVAMTLKTYLREDRSRTRAAARLSVHPNTVSYRVHQAEVLLQSTLSADTLALQVALELLPALRALRQRRNALSAGS